MSKIDLAELRRLEAKIGSGPWVYRAGSYDCEEHAVGECPDDCPYVYPVDCPVVDSPSREPFSQEVDDGYALSEESAAFIAAARNALPALVEIAEAAYEVCRSIPADFEGPGADRHADALNRLRAILREADLDPDER